MTERYPLIYWCRNVKVNIICRFHKLLAGITLMTSSCVTYKITLLFISCIIRKDAECTEKLRHPIILKCRHSVYSQLHKCEFIYKSLAIPIPFSLFTNIYSSVHCRKHSTHIFLRSKANKNH